MTPQEEQEVLKMAVECGIRYRHIPLHTTEMWCFQHHILEFAERIRQKQKVKNLDAVHSHISFEEWKEIR